MTCDALKSLDHSSFAIDFKRKHDHERPLDHAFGRALFGSNQYSVWHECVWMRHHVDEMQRVLQNGD